MVRVYEHRHFQSREKTSSYCTLHCSLCHSVSLTMETMAATLWSSGSSCLSQENSCESMIWPLAIMLLNTHPQQPSMFPNSVKITIRRVQWLMSWLVFNFASTRTLSVALPIISFPSLSIHPRLSHPSCRFCHLPLLNKPFFFAFPFSFMFIFQLPCLVGENLNWEPLPF